MGYDVHIVRAEHWLDSEEHPITLQEWLAYVRSDPEMRLDGYAEARMPDGRVLRTEAEGIAVWTAWSRHGFDGGMAWFGYWRGSIEVKNPDEQIRCKMHRIATQLGARVQGDDGEVYDASGQPSEGS